MIALGTRIQYKEYTFRSLHELAWAKYLDARGLAWEYVKFRDPNAPPGLGYSYTPDFRVEQIVFLEIKASFAQHINRLHFCTKPLLFIVGLPVRPTIRLVERGAIMPPRLTDFDTAFNSWQEWIAVMDTIAFFRHLHRAGAYAYYHALPERRSYWFTTDKLLAPPEEATTNWYISVHPSSAIPPCNAHGEIKAPMFVRAQKRYISAINCLYGEFDAKTYGSKESIAAHIDGATWPTPSVLIDSGGGLHGYWLLREPWILETDEARQAAELVQRLWVQNVIGADPSVHDLTRILRVPGTRNFKYDPPPPVEYVYCALERTYTLQALTAHLPAVHEAEPRFKNDPPKRARNIEHFNAQTEIGAMLERYGYTWAGRYRMVSPDSGSSRAGVTVDVDSNRAYIHTGGDPLCDGYWKRPFDVLRIREYNGDFTRALEAIRS